MDWLLSADGSTETVATRLSETLDNSHFEDINNSRDAAIDPVAGSTYYFLLVHSEVNGVVNFLAESVTCFFIRYK